jgi:hypothetical protein
MKKIVLSVILTTCVITGFLHSNQKNHEQIKNIFAVQTYTMPDVIINPLIDPIPY